MNFDKPLFYLSVYRKIDIELGTSVYVSNYNDELNIYSFNQLSPGSACYYREYYNPLVAEQHKIFIDNKAGLIYMVPVIWIGFYNDSNMLLLAEIFEAAGEYAELLKLIAEYVLTKDLIFMNRLVKQVNFNLHLFKCVEEFFVEPSIEKIRSIIKLLNTGYKSIERALLTDFGADMLLSEPKLSLQASYCGRLAHQQAFKAQVVNEIKENPQPKNLVLIHLESLSNKIYQEHRHLLPALTQLGEKSIQFRRYYSAATSTIMSMSAILYGNNLECDRFTSFNDCKVRGYYQENIFSTLERLGYSINSASLSDGKEINENFIEHALDKQQIKFKPVANFGLFSQKIENFFVEQKQHQTPYVLFVDNQTTHCSIEDEESKDGFSHDDKKELAYISLNKTIALIKSSLIKNNLLEDTVIVLYGDHGDDKWTREINGGFSHITKPYGNVISTPLFIYDSRFSSGVILDDLVGSQDIKQTVLFLLGDLGKKTKVYQPHIMGINIFLDNQSYLFSNALFANQNPVQKILNQDMQMMNNFSDVEYKNKSYAIVSDKYNLIVSDDGLELYNLSSDADNYCNLLQFFEFNDQGEAVKFIHYGAWRGHFRLEMMNSVQIYQNLSYFYKLRSKLIEHISLREALVKEAVDKNNEIFPFDFNNFLRIKKSNFVEGNQK